MRAIDFAGYIASGLVLVTFYMKDMVSLRVAALCSNVAFLIYGMGLGLIPVVLLHGALIPMNVWRLVSALRVREVGATISMNTAPSPDTIASD
jgi:CRP/FNR family cyclic AMP-dependent transcriptional regulator